MLDIEPRAVSLGIIARRHFLKHLVVDHAAIDRRTGGGEQERLGLHR
jgi:hypothetical protein